MIRFLASLPLAAVCFAAPASADELIRQANNQEALMLGASYLRAGLQSVDQAGAPVFNEMSGPQIDVGYADTRMRTLFGLPNFYTRVELSFGLGQQNFSGTPTDPSTGAAGTSDGPFYADSESLRLRLGYSKEFGAGGHLVLTPFLGFAQEAWLREGTNYSGTTVYNHYVVEIGVLAQATVTPKVVLGVDASLGHTLGAWEFDRGDLIAPRTGIAPSFALYLDNRTSSDWHQRLILRQSYLRYGEPAKSVGSLEPRRNSALSLHLEFGTERDLFKTLFR